jgi:hypothetical protein
MHDFISTFESVIDEERTDDDRLIATLVKIIRDHEIEQDKKNLDSKINEKLNIFLEDLR